MKFGLALSGGGVKGFAHVGVIQVLEDAGFQPDIISGSSIGSVIAALYATGLSPSDIMGLRDDLQFIKLLTLNNPINGFLSMKGLKKQLSQYIGNVKFNELEMDLVIAATNLNTSDPHYFMKGSVIDAVMASCSVPGVFNPVKIGDEYFVDGGFSSSVPVKVLKDLGAKRVISVSLEHIGPLTKRPTTLKLLERAPNLLRNNILRWEESFADVPIRVPTYKFNTLSINQASKLYDLGVETARQALPEIKKILE